MQSDERLAEVLTLQQQRSQFLLLQQLQEARNVQQLAGTDGPAPSGVMLGVLGMQSIMRPVEQPGLRICPVLKNPAHLRAKTLTLLGGGGGNPPTALRFSFDTSTSGVATVYRSVQIAAGAHGHWEIESAAWSSPAVPFAKGLSQVHSVEWAALPQSQQIIPMTGPLAPSSTGDVGLGAPVPQWAFLHCPLLIELRADSELDEAVEAGPPCVEWTLCRLVSSSGVPHTTVEVLRQQVSCGRGQILDTLEFFGSEPGLDGITRQDCIVCQSEPRDTAVLPCRHMCLCRGCSEYIRTRVQYSSYKCPICRERISRMMRVEEMASPEVSVSVEEPDSELAGDPDGAVALGTPVLVAEPEIAGGSEGAIYDSGNQDTARTAAANQRAATPAEGHRALLVDPSGTAAAGGHDPPLLS